MDFKRLVARGYDTAAERLARKRGQGSGVARWLAQLSEALPTGWVLTNIVCVGGSGITFLGSGSGAGTFTPGDSLVTIPLTAGQNVTCIFTNGTPAVGGIVELPGDADTLAEASDSSTWDYTAPIAAVAAAVVALAAAGWYARRRFLR